MFFFEEHKVGSFEFFFWGGGVGGLSCSNEVGLGGVCIEFVARCQKMVSIDRETFSSARCPGNRAQSY